MFLVSGPELVLAQCRAGILGTFPALNARTSEQLDEWLDSLVGTLRSEGHEPAFGVNLINNRKANARLDADLAACVRHKVPLVISSLGLQPDVFDAIHSYGGKVIQTVISRHHAEKSIAAGVDGIVLVCSGAGGHCGTLNPLAFVEEVRSFYSGFLALSGCIVSGRGILSALAMGVDAAYIGTRFIATHESRAAEAYRQMIVDCGTADVVNTAFFTGVSANFLRPSIEAQGLDIAEIAKATPPALKRMGAPASDAPGAGAGAGANGGASAAGPGGEAAPQPSTAEYRSWRDIWGAGQGVGGIAAVETVADVVARLEREYRDALDRLPRF